MSNHTRNQTKNIAKDKPIKGIRYLFRPKKEDNGIKDEVLRYISVLFEPEEDYYKAVKILNAFDNNYIEYESNADKDKAQSIKEYLNEIKPYLNDIINDHKTQGEWKIQLTVAINFMSSKDSKETRIMHIKSNNIENIGNETNEIIEELFEYQEGFEESMKEVNLF